MTRSKKSVYDQVEAIIQTTPRVEPALYHAIMTACKEGGFQDSEVYRLARNNYGRASYSDDGIRMIVEEIRRVRSVQPRREVVEPEPVVEETGELRLE